MGKSAGPDPFDLENYSGDPLTEVELRKVRQGLAQRDFYRKGRFVFFRFFVYLGVLVGGGTGAYVMLQNILQHMLHGPR